MLFSAAWPFPQVLCPRPHCANPVAQIWPTPVPAAPFAARLAPHSLAEPQEGGSPCHAGVGAGLHQQQVMPLGGTVL